MLRKKVYPLIEGTLNQLALKLKEQGFTANQLTLIGLAVNFLAGCVFITGNFFLAGLLLILASLGDMLDGPLARVSNQVSKFGAFLDSTVDRYSDFFLFGGLAVFFAKQGEGLWLLMSLGIILGSFVTSYAKARSENFIPSCSVGFLERAERIILLALASLIIPLLPAILWILLIGTHATAIQRILFVKNALASPPTEEE